MASKKKKINHKQPLLIIKSMRGLFFYEKHNKSNLRNNWNNNRSWICIRKRNIFVFNIYGIKGLYGISVASIITGIVIYKVLLQIRNREYTRNYKEYLEKLGVNEKVREILSIIINIFLLISFYIMIAGFCAYFNQEFNIPKILVGIIVCSMCHITFMSHIEGVTKINTILIPF